MEAISSLAVIIPCFNEEETVISVITNTIDAFSQYNITGEIIVVDDASHDNTLQVVENWICSQSTTCRCKTDVKVIKHSENMGLGYSFYNGAQAAIADFIVMIPGDGENEPMDCLKYFTALSSKVDIIIPFVCNSRQRGLTRHIASKLYTRIINIAFNASFNYTNGTVIYKTSVYRRLAPRAHGFFYQTEALVRLKFQNSATYAEVPTYIKPNKATRVSRAFRFRTLIDISISVALLFVELNSILLLRLVFGR